MFFKKNGKNNNSEHEVRTNEQIMTCNADFHHRCSIRLKDYDYAATGAYFVTVCVQERECLFGKIVDGVMVSNDAGQMVEMVWNELSLYYYGVVADNYVVMPNHFHGIVMLNVGAAPRGRPVAEIPHTGGADQRPSRNFGHIQDKGHPQGGAPTMSLFDVVHRFKSFATARYRYGVNHLNWPPFPGRLWQRNYYERVIRNEDELSTVREYIRFNPLKWMDDEENPVNVHP
jgi:putative transposase